MPVDLFWDQQVFTSVTVFAPGRQDCPPDQSRQQLECTFSAAPCVRTFSRARRSEVRTGRERLTLALPGLGGRSSKHRLSSQFRGHFHVGALRKPRIDPWIGVNLMMLLWHPCIREASLGDGSSDLGTCHWPSVAATRTPSPD